MGSVVDNDFAALVAGRLVFVFASVDLVTMDSLALLGLEDFRADATLILVLAVVTLALKLLTSV